MFDPPEPVSDGNAEWIQSGNDVQSGLKSAKNTRVPGNDEKYNTTCPDKTSDCPERDKWESVADAKDAREPLGRVRDPKGDVTHPSSRELLSCHECGKSFGWKTNLKRHIKTHTGEKAFICSVCGKSFIQRITLVQHTRTHTGERPYPCSVCDRRFTQQQHLVQHMSTHTKVKPFTCSVCAKTFIRHSTLVLHMRRHTGEKPFGCGACGERFAWRSQLKTHKCADESSGRK